MLSRILCDFGWYADPLEGLLCAAIDAEPNRIDSFRIEDLMYLGFGNCTRVGQQVDLRESLLPHHG